MLELFRSNLGGWVAKVFIGLLVASFALWGIADYSSSSSSNTVVQAGETAVDAQQYRFAFDRQVLVASQQFGRRLSVEEARAFGIDQQVLSQVASNAVWDETARTLNLGLSDDKLAQTIARDEAFQDSSGNYNSRIFASTLQNAGLRPEDYIELQKQIMVRQQLVTGTLVDTGLNDTFFDILAEHQAQRRDVQYITIGKDQIEIADQPTDEELNAYFDLNKLNYRAPEYRSFAYLKADVQSLAKVDEVSDEVVREEYDANLASFTQPSQRTIEQIVLKDDDMRQRAQDILGGGGSFDDLVAEFGLKLSDLNLGTLTKANYQDPLLAEIAFDVVSGTTTDIVKGSFGDVVLRVTEERAQTVQPFESVAARLKEEIAYGEAADAIFETREAIEDARASGKTLDQIASEQSLELIEVTLDQYGVDEADELNGDVVNAGELLTNVFETEVAVETDPLSLDAPNVADDGYVWFEVRDIKEARDRELSEVKDKVIDAWRGEQIAQAVDDKAQEFLAKGQGGQSIQELATELGVSVEEANGISRSDADTGLSRAALITAFEGKDGFWGTSIGANESETIVLFAKDANASDEPLSKELSDNVKRSFTDDLFAQLTANFQSKIKPTVNQAVVERAITSNN